MISRIRIEARASSMEEARREIEALLGHAQMAGYLEGLCPQASHIVDDHFGAVYAPDPWRALDMGYEGRIVLKFDPEPNPGGGLREYGYAVTRTDKDQNLPADVLSADEGKDVTADVIVLGRQCPVTRDSAWDLAEALAPLDAGPRKPTVEELQRFGRLANRDEVTTIEFGRSKSRRGYEIELTYYKPSFVQSSVEGVTVSGPSGIGGHSVEYGETFSDALAAAEAVVDAL
jgi:hypothetical protein